jgi:hypothetical protein
MKLKPSALHRCSLKFSPDFPITKSALNQTKKQHYHKKLCHKVNAFHIENDLTIKSEIIVKSASIASITVNYQLA